MRVSGRERAKGVYSHSPQSPHRPHSAPTARCPWRCPSPGKLAPPTWLLTPCAHPQEQQHSIPRTWAADRPHLGKQRLAGAGRPIHQNVPIKALVLLGVPRRDGNVSHARFQTGLPGNGAVWGSLWGHCVSPWAGLRRQLIPGWATGSRFYFRKEEQPDPAGEELCGQRGTSHPPKGRHHLH